jgi:hypothetical protein
MARSGNVTEKPRDSFVFALRAYRGAPADTVDILLPSELLGSDDLRATVLEIAHALGISADRIRWPENPQAVAQTEAVTANPLTDPRSEQPLVADEENATVSGLVLRGVEASLTAIRVRLLSECVFNTIDIPVEDGDKSDSY